MPTSGASGALLGPSAVLAQEVVLEPPHHEPELERLRRLQGVSLLPPYEVLRAVGAVVVQFAQRGGVDPFFLFVDVPGGAIHAAWFAFVDPLKRLVDCLRRVLGRQVFSALALVELQTRHLRLFGDPLEGDGTCPAADVAMAA